MMDMVIFAVLARSEIFQAFVFHVLIKTTSVQYISTSENIRLLYRFAAQARPPTKPEANPPLRWFGI